MGCISIFLLVPTITSSSDELERCFCGRFGDQEMLLAMNFEDRSILPRNLNKVKYQLQNRSENRVKGIFQCRLTVSPVSLLLSAMRAYRKYVSVWLFTVNPTCLT